MRSSTCLISIAKPWDANPRPPHKPTTMSHLPTQEEQEQLLLRRKLHLLLKTGQMLIESLADTSRVTRNMKRAAAFLGIPEEKLHIHISYTMLLVNISDEKHSMSKFQKCEKHSVNMQAITDISHLSWRAIREDYSLDQYEEELKKIEHQKRNYSPIATAVMAGFACGGFCKLFGCDWMAFFFASLCAMIGFRLRFHCIRLGINHYMSVTIAAFASTILAFATSKSGLSSTPHHPLLACALFIVPGVPIINFVDDMISDYLVVGFTRFLNCTVTLTAMAFGIMFALHVLSGENVTIAESFGELSMVPHDTYFIYAVAAAISAVGFSFIFNIPRKLLWFIALGGALAVCTRNFVNFELGYGPIFGSFVGAFLVSVIGIKAVHWFNVPNHTFTIPMVIPMIPGVLIYRCLLALITMKGVVGEVTNATYNGMNAALIILCISIGVAVPKIFIRRFLGQKRQLKLQQQLAERKARGKFLEW